MKSEFLQKIKDLGGLKLNVLVREDKQLSSHFDVNSNLASLNKIFNFKIPQDYVDFIEEVGAITFNNPVITHGIDEIPIANNQNQVSIDNFFGLSNNEASLIKVLNRFKGNISNYVLPICEGAMGDLVVIDLSNSNNGKIYYWYHEHEQDSDGLYLISNDFKEFICGLSNKDIKEDNVSTDNVKVKNVSNKFLERLRKSGRG